MFGSVLDDFDPRYWSRTAIAVLVVISAAVGGGTAWLLVELLSRVAWFLLQLLLAWLMPPHLVLAILPTPPLQAVVVERYASVRAAAEDPVAIDDLGDPDWDPTPDVVMSLDAVRPPAETPEPLHELGTLRMIGSLTNELAIADVIGEADHGVLALLGVSGGDSISNVWGDDGPGVELRGLSGVGSGGGGLGSGGGGVAVGLGGLGTRGRGDVVGGVVGGVEGGVVTGTVGGSISGGSSRPARVLSKGPVDLGGAVPEDGARCTVRVQVGADGGVEGLKYVSCPDALRGVVDASVRASTFEAAVDGDGAPTTGHVLMKYVFEG